METADLMKKLAAYGADTQGVMERFLGDAELFETCLDLFLADSNFERLGEALEGADYQKAFEAAHGLKGVAGNLGLTPAYNAICEIVEALRTERYEQLDRLYQRVMDEFEKVKAIS